MVKIKSDNVNFNANNELSIQLLKKSVSITAYKGNSIRGIGIACLQFLRKVFLSKTNDLRRNWTKLTCGDNNFCWVQTNELTRGLFGKELSNSQCFKKIEDYFNAINNLKTHPIINNNEITIESTEDELTIAYKTKLGTEEIILEEKFQFSDNAQLEEKIQKLENANKNLSEINIIIQNKLKSHFIFDKEKQKLIFDFINEKNEKEEQELNITNKIENYENLLKFIKKCEIIDYLKIKLPDHSRNEFSIKTNQEKLEITYKSSLPGDKKIEYTETLDFSNEDLCKQKIESFRILRDNIKIINVVIKNNPFQNLIVLNFDNQSKKLTFNFFDSTMEIDLSKIVDENLLIFPKIYCDQFKHKNQIKKLVQQASLENPEISYTNKLTVFNKEIDFTLAIDLQSKDLLNELNKLDRAIHLYDCLPESSKEDLIDANAIQFNNDFNDPKFLINFKGITFDISIDERLEDSLLSIETIILFKPDEINLTKNERTTLEIECHQGILIKKINLKEKFGKGNNKDLEHLVDNLFKINQFLEKPALNGSRKSYNLKEFSFKGPIYNLTLKCEYPFYELFTHQFEMPLFKTNEVNSLDNINRFLTLIELYKNIPKKIRNVCLEIVGKNIDAVIIANLLHEQNCNKIEEINKKITAFNTFNHYKNLFLGLNNYTHEQSKNLIHLGQILLRLDEEKQEYYLGGIKKILEERSISSNILRIDQINLDKIKERFLQSIQIPPKISHNNGSNNELQLLYVMASMDQTTKIECVKWVIEEITAGKMNENLKYRGYTLFSLLNYLEEKDRINILADLVNSPKGLSTFITPFLYFDKVKIKSGYSVDTCSDILMNNLLQVLPMHHLEGRSKLSESISKAIENSGMIVSSKKTEAFTIKNKDKIFGRTVTQKKSLEDKKIQVFKFMKKDENETQFHQEAEIIRALKAEEVFKSELPHILEFTEFRKVLKHDSFESIQHLSKIRLAEKSIALIFDVSEDYYNYLHQLEGKNYQQARERWLHDSLYLLRNGWFHESTPMYHNQSQKRPYLFLVGLLHASSCPTWFAAGRLDTPRLYNQFPNVGATGIRDLGDLKNIETIANNPNNFSTDLGRSYGFPSYHPDVQARKNLLTTNFLATHRLMDTLLLAMSLENDPNFKWDWKCKESRERLIAEGIRGMALTIAGYSEVAFGTCEEIAKHAMDWNQWAKEILFWWTPDQEDNYTNYLDDNGKTLPNDPLDSNKPFYPKGHEIDLTDSTNYLPGFGFCNKEIVSKIFKKRQEESSNYTKKDLRKDKEAKLYLDIGAYNSSLLLHTLEIDGYLTSAIALILAEKNFRH